tara:strand:+ start:319 stop:777 length:459 start_codon:yes stop_codon:yes gene_type:complete
MKIQFLVVAATIALLGSGCASSGDRVPMYYVDAAINSIDKAPSVCSSNGDGRGNPLLGGAVGGLVGNQFGSGKGRVAMTLLGIGIGVNVAKGDKRKGSKLKCSSNGYIASVSFNDPITGYVVRDFVRLEKNTRVKAINIPVCVYPNGTRTCI